MSNMRDIAELFETDEMSERAADLAGSDQCNLGTRHVKDNLVSKTPEFSGRAGIGRQGRCTAS